MTRAPLLLFGLVLLAGCAARPLPLEDAGLPPHMELRQTPFFAQQAYQCGPAALATLLVQRGVDTTPEALVGRVYLPVREGSLQVEMVAAARAEGLLVYPLEPRLEALLTELAAGNPVLVLQNLGGAAWPQWHFAVLVGYDLAQQRLILRSGTEARASMTFRAFLRSWHAAGRWAVLTLPPERLPATARLQTWLLAASDLEQSGHPETAGKAYRRALEQWPQDGLAGFALANNRYAAGDAKGAEQALRDSLARDPAFAPAWFNLGQVLAARGCDTEALAARQCAIGLAPTDERLRAGLSGLAEARRGHCAAVPVCPAAP